MNKGKGPKGKPAAGGQKLFQGQLPNEANDVYVRRAYARKTGEVDDDYFLRISSKYSSESEEEYKARIALIQSIFSDLPLKERLIYDDHAKMYIYVRSAGAAGGSKGHPGQLQNESDETYVRRVYARKSGEDDRDYYMRVTSRYSSETDESYKTRVELVFSVFTDISKENVKWDDNKRLFMYIQTTKSTKKGAHINKGYPGQQPNEPDEAYVRRVYTKKSEETEETYILRVTSRYSTETDEVYKSRIQLIITIIKEVNIQEHIKYDEKKKLYVYIKPSGGPKKPGDASVPVPKDGSKPTGYPGQQPNEPDEAYVRRVYTKKSEETEETYILRVTSRYSTETDEVYKSRIQLIVSIFKELNIMEHITYREDKGLYVYRRSAKSASDPKLYHCQEPGEADEDYVRRVYTQGPNESERDYYLRVTSRSSTETDDKYKARIDLIQRVLSHLPLKEKILYDDHAKIYIYVQSTKQGGGGGGSSSGKGFPGQQSGESNEAYAKRVYTRKPGESEMDYYLRFTSRYSSETNDSYKARIDLIANTFSDQNLYSNMSYDEGSGLFIYMQPL